MISIVIPARNEEEVIGRTLRAITTGAAVGEFDVIVVCNGCTDNTASIARSFRPPVRVIETEVGSKPRALNLGDIASEAFPRIYVDADVLISSDSIRKLAGRLGVGDVLAVAPQASIDLSGCSWYVRAYYDIRYRLPTAREGIGGSGVYALSQAGRLRFGEFPDVTADDGYVRIQFTPRERETLADAKSTVFAPRNIQDLVRVRTRARYGTIELARLFPDLWQNVGDRNHRSVVGLLRSPPLWPKILVYSFVNIFARYGAVARSRRANADWARDNSSRRASVSTSSITESESTWPS
jgi:glycosyltransferase involved in cell wall biosynthesis